MFVSDFTLTKAKGHPDRRHRFSLNNGLNTVAGEQSLHTYRQQSGRNQAEAGHGKATGAPGTVGLVGSKG